MFLYSLGPLSCSKGFGNLAPRVPIAVQSKSAHGAEFDNEFDVWSKAKLHSL